MRVAYLHANQPFLVSLGERSLIPRLCRACHCCTTDFFCKRF